MFEMSLNLISEEKSKQIAKEAYLSAWKKKCGKKRFEGTILERTAESHFEEWWSQNYE